MTQQTRARNTANAKHTTNGFWWSDLQTNDVDAAKTFYGTLLGWSYDDKPMDDGELYSIALIDGLTVSALSGQPKEQREQDAVSYTHLTLPTKRIV